MSEPDCAALLEGLEGSERAAREDLLRRLHTLPGGARAAEISEEFGRFEELVSAYELRGIGEPVPALRAFTSPAASAGS